MNKVKRSSTPIWTQFWLHILLCRSFHLNLLLPIRTCTRQFATLVQFPTYTNSLKRTVDIRRIDEQAYWFDVKSRYFLGRGTYYLVARAQGQIIYDHASQKSDIRGVVHISTFYLFTLIILTCCALFSFLIVKETILFLPIALFMFAMCMAHWFTLFQARSQLLQSIIMLFDPSRDT